MSTEADQPERTLDPDPTGMRALLRSLPDPGPMPEGLVERITTSLAAEQVLRDASPPVAATRVPHPGGDMWRHTGHAAGDLTRNRRIAILVAAAVVAGVAGIGAVIASGVPGTVVAAVSGSRSGAAGSASRDAAATGGQDRAAAPAPAESAAAESAPAGSGLADSAPVGGTGLPESSTAGAAATAGSVAPVISASGTDWTAAKLAAAALPLLGADPHASRMSLPQNVQPIATDAGARACAGALGLDASRGLAVDLGTHAGLPVAAVVARAGDGAVTVVVVDRTCTTGSTRIIDGPMPAAGEQPSP